MIRIFLIGYMGSGKTTLGKEIAKVLQLSFVDLDWHIEERYHKTVSELFEQHGESGFRDIERKMLHEIAAFENVVISTGGGAPCFFDNMELMNRQGMTVFLDTSVNLLFDRLRVARSQRPILRDKDDEELMHFIQTALQKRLPFYNQAQYIFKADELESRKQIDKSVARLRQLLSV